jgi:hypothetical protein
MANIPGYIENNREEVQRLVGLKYEQLQQLIQNALIKHDQKSREAEKQKIRIIKGGGGRKVKLFREQQKGFDPSA